MPEVYSNPEVMLAKAKMTTSDTPPVGLALKRVDGMLEEALLSIGELRKRLEPVLAPDKGVGEDSCEVDDGTRSPMVEKLDDLYKRLGWVNAQVNDLTRRLQI